MRVRAGLGLPLVGMLLSAVTVPPAAASIVEARRPDPAVAPSSEWVSAIEDTIAASEYRFAPAGPHGFSAPNRKHGLRIRAEAGGLMLAPRAAPKRGHGPWELSLELSRWGREGGLSEVRHAEPELDGARVVYHRAGITEWYLNGEDGLEQGFDITSSPGGSGEKGPLILEMDLQSTLGAFPSLDGHEVLFKDTQSVVVLKCSELRVVDAAGRPIGARFEVRPRALRIVIEDSTALYPLVVDPLYNSPSWSVLGGQASSFFGGRVVTAGDVNRDGYSDVLVSASTFDNGELDEGRVFLFLGSPGGLSTVPDWTAESNQAGAIFGSDAGPAGDVNGDGFADVVVSAHGFDNGQADEGAAFVYYGFLGGLSTTPSLVLEIDQGGARFGTSARTAGDVNGDGYDDLIVGASQYDNGEADEGAVFVYHGGPAGLPASPSWRGEMNLATSFLGISSASAGDTNGDGYDDVVAGAYFWANGQSTEGAVFVWPGGPSGLAASPLWQTESNLLGARLGSAVAGVGDVNGDGYADILAGAPNRGNTFFRPGSAYLYLGSSSGPQLPAAWTASGEFHNALFGNAVATAGDVNANGYADVLVGAPGDNEFYTSGGTAYLYLGSPAGLEAGASWYAGGGTDDRFGSAVGAAGDVDGDGYAEIIIGAPRQTGTINMEGMAILYRGTPDTLSTLPVWTGEGNQASGQFGFGLADAGDVNGDGFTDVIVGCPSCSNGEGGEGMAFLFTGGPTGLSATAASSVESNQAGAQFGFSVAGAGDVNGDGFGDVIVGAWLYDNGQENEGAAFVYLGGPLGLQSAAAWSAEGNQAAASFGFSVAAAGDANADGIGDVIVGAPDMDNGEAEEGMAFLHLGSPWGLAPAPAWMSEGGQAGAALGYSVAPAGDMNRDGFSDIVVGSPGYDYQGRIDSGRASVFMGASFGLQPFSIWDIVIWSPGAALGREVGTAGDVSGDGYADIIVGAPFDDYAGSDAGTGLVLYGSSTMFTSPVDFIDGAPGWYAGASVSTAGDVNGDGYSDVIVGAYAFTSVITPIPNEGLVQLYLGSASGISTVASWGAVGGQTSGFFGRRVRMAGDINADGFSDIVVGAPNNANGQAGEGMVRAFYGNANEGLHIPIVQKTTNGASVVSPLGWSDDEDAIGLQVTARTPAGRGRVRVETELKQLTIPFNGLGTWLSPWNATGAPAPVDGSTTVIEEVHEPLLTSPSRMYRWRTRLLTANPLFPHTRWLWAPANAPTEGDIWLAGCRDFDGDGYGSPASALCAAGAVSDCDDSRIEVYPGAAEVCDGLDNDCNTLADDLLAPGQPDLGILTTGKLVWINQPGTTASDLVRGDLGPLRSTPGDFTVALTGCLRNDHPTASHLDTDLPAPETGFWYLVRPIGCGVAGSYDEGVPSQIGSRDAEIAAAPAACP